MKSALSAVSLAIGLQFPPTEGLAAQAGNTLDTVSLQGNSVATAQAVHPQAVHAQLMQELSEKAQRLPAAFTDRSLLRQINLEAENSQRLLNATSPDLSGYTFSLVTSRAYTLSSELGFLVNKHESAEKRAAMSTPSLLPSPFDTSLREARTEYRKSFEVGPEALEKASQKLEKLENAHGRFVLSVPMTGVSLGIAALGALVAFRRGSLHKQLNDALAATPIDEGVKQAVRERYEQARAKGFFPGLGEALRLLSALEKEARHTTPPPQAVLVREGSLRVGVTTAALGLVGTATAGAMNIPSPYSFLAGALIGFTLGPKIFGSEKRRDEGQRLDIRELAPSRETK